MPATKGLALDTAAAYRIRIQGDRDQSWSDYVGDVSIQVQTQPESRRSRRSPAEFQDQAALAGALTHLYELGFPLLSVEVVTIGTLH